MLKIYSKVEPNKLLHMCYNTNANTFNNDSTIASKDLIRHDLIPNTEFLQLAHITINTAGHKFKPHKHRFKFQESGSYSIAQEAWMILSGKIEATFYDLDNSIISVVVLNVGDVSITLYGGHTYEALEPNTQVLEFKTGPYEGQEIDKEFI